MKNHIWMKIVRILQGVENMNRPTWAKAVGLGIIGGFGALAFSRLMKDSYKATPLYEPQQMFTLGDWPDLTPPPYWSRPLYADNSSLAATTFLTSPARKSAAVDTPLPLHSHMEKYDVRYDTQQQKMINSNLRELFSRWR